jgi:CheY-like chemotaxis protein/HPt (histidine-containing phosphotransfer) domain-containing protein
LAHCVILKSLRPLLMLPIVRVGSVALYPTSRRCRRLFLVQAIVNRVVFVLQRIGCPGRSKAAQPASAKRKGVSLSPCNQRTWRLEVVSDADPRKRILVAEADRADRLLIGEILAQADYLVDSVADGSGAARAAADRCYDLFLLALVLPEMDGVEATRHIRRLPYPHGDGPILTLAGTPIAADWNRCYAVGMDGFLTKPIDRLELLETVAEWIETADAPSWGLEARPGVTPALLNPRTLTFLEEDVGSDLLREILLTFIEEGERRLRLLEARVEAGDAAGAAAEAHALKGSAGTFGAMALRQCVHEMEESGRAGDGKRLIELRPEARRWFDLTCALLHTRYPPSAP